MLTWKSLIVVALVQQCAPLPLVDSGLFVILGVGTCREGAGYCLLGADCTLDHDFSPDDTGGHCNGLRSAFTPAANFVCCKYNGAGDVKLPATTTEAPPPTPPALKITTVEVKPSRRPVISAAVKPSSGGAASDEAPGAIFWVDLNSSASGGGGGGNGGGWVDPGKVVSADTHPGSALVAGGGAAAAPQQVLVQDAPDLSNWLKPGVTLDIAGIVASRPGSTVTLTASNQLLDEITQQAVGAEVAHGVSIAQQAPSLQLDAVEEQAAPQPAPPVGAIEAHEPLRPATPTATTPLPATPLPATPLTAKPSKPSTVRPTTAAPQEEEEEEASDEDEEEESDEEEEEDDDGLFGLADLVELLGLDTAQKAGAAQITAKNDSVGNSLEDGAESKVGGAELTERVDLEEPEKLVGGFLNANASYETSTLPLGALFSSTVAPSTAVVPEEEEEAPPLCLGPVRGARHEACWAVALRRADSGQHLCWGARVTSHLVVTSASCAVRISSLGVAKMWAWLPAERGNATLASAVVHDHYHAAPHLALNDVGLVTLARGAEAAPPAECTLCLAQDDAADLTRLRCSAPLPSVDEEGKLESVALAEQRLAPCPSPDASSFLCAQAPPLHQVGEGSPVVCSGRRGIPFLAAVRSSSASAATTVFTPLGAFADWIRANELPQIA